MWEGNLQLNVPFIVVMIRFRIWTFGWRWQHLEGLCHVDSIGKDTCKRKSGNVGMLCFMEVV